MRRLITNLIIVLISIISLFLSIKSLLSNDIVNFLKTLLVIPVLLIPKKLVKKQIVSYDLYFLYVLFIFFAYFLGCIINFYGIIKIYDTLMHFLSGIFISYLALDLLKYLKVYKKNNVIHTTLFIVGIVSLSAVIWESFEFICNILFKTDPQNVLTTGVTDTMKDIIIALIGSLIVSFKLSYDVLKK